MTTESALEKGMVPVSELLEIILPYEHEIDPHSSLARIIFRWKEEVEFAEFASADRVLCQLHLQENWWGSLSHLYYGVNLKAPPRETGKMRTCEGPGCSQQFELKRGKGSGRGASFRRRYCSVRCRRRAERHRKVELRRLPWHKEKYECYRGHIKGPDNRDSRGQCLTCKRERAKESYQRHREKRLKEQKAYYRANRERILAQKSAKARAA